MKQWVIDGKWPEGRVWDLKDENGQFFGFVQRCPRMDCVLGYVLGDSPATDHGPCEFPTMEEAAKWVADASVLPTSLLSKEDV